MKATKLLILVVALALVVGAFSACGDKKEAEVAPVEPPAVEEPAPVEPAPVEPAPVEPASPATEESSGEVELDAAILERKALLPGDFFKVHYTITNNSDKLIGYAHGSGSAVVPDALVITSADIQVVPAKENLGAMTMDFRVEVLEPGTSKEFVKNFIAVSPTEDFIQKAMDYTAKTGEYIGEQNLETIGDNVEGLTAVAAGQYTIDGSFGYTVLESSEDLSPVSEATNQATVSTQVSIG